MRLIFKDEALKRLKRIGAADSNKVQRKIEYLKEYPLAGKQLHGVYEGKYSLRAGPLRIIYTCTPDTQTIKILTIDYRGDVYKG
jgi:mRNA-degrading endonuclease RelE of RelBE toxin-antitoxin system